ncbi:MAG: 3-dehydroquinate synthase [Caldimicrobium sp.]|nr:3-dehydroquinate synthase [Caldimicrobium sp.]MCX7613111.1 3-dehydroquinate synthase [Caldimicrobium sp.]MDW8182921.1 3-dehydroquinate synthase [Caldimicrobium sp.]
MKVVTVRTKPAYQIKIGANLLEFLPRDITNIVEFGKIALITDTRVEKLLGETLLEILRKARLYAELFSFPEGEGSKNVQTVVDLARRMIRASYDRKDLILALGGGVVGDIAGFLASIYLRGIPFIQVPTTLLAQVDSSIGGKTGVDLPEGKNLLGTFYQPRAVYIDTEVLKTLPQHEIKNGLAEVIKYGCILNRPLFNFLLKRSSSIYQLRSQDFEYMIYHSCLTKAQVVKKDEKEAGLRRVLNFGHTYGHALETISGYTISHGLAVAVGMAIEAKLSELLKINSEPVYEPLVELLSNLGLPYRVNQLGLQFSREELINLMFKDKKVWKGKLTIVLLKKIGEYLFYEDPPQDMLMEALDGCF